MSFEKEWEEEITKKRTVPDVLIEDMQDMNKLDAVKEITVFFCKDVAEEIYNKQEERIIELERVIANLSPRRIQQ